MFLISKIKFLTTVVGVNLTTNKRRQEERKLGENFSILQVNVAASLFQVILYNILKRLIVLEKFIPLCSLGQ